MYYEQSKKNYYRFPSFHNIHDLDMKYYFPEKTKLSQDDAHFNSQLSETVTSSKSSYDI